MTDRSHPTRIAFNFTDSQSEISACVLKHRVTSYLWNVLFIVYAKSQQNCWHNSAEVVIKITTWAKSHAIRVKKNLILSEAKRDSKLFPEIPFIHTFQMIFAIVEWRIRKFVAHVVITSGSVAANWMTAWTLIFAAFESHVWTAKISFDSSTMRSQVAYRPSSPHKVKIWCLFVGR